MLPEFIRIDNDYIRLSLVTRTVPGHTENSLILFFVGGDYVELQGEAAARVGMLLRSVARDITPHETSV